VLNGPTIDRSCPCSGPPPPHRHTVGKARAESTDAVAACRPPVAAARCVHPHLASRSLPTPHLAAPPTAATKARKLTTPRLRRALVALWVGWEGRCVAIGGQFIRTHCSLSNPLAACIRYSANIRPGMGGGSSAWQGTAAGEALDGVRSLGSVARGSPPCSAGVDCIRGGLPSGCSRRDTPYICPNRLTRHVCGSCRACFHGCTLLFKLLSARTGAAFVWIGDDCGIAFWGAFGARKLRWSASDGGREARHSEDVDDCVCRASGTGGPRTTASETDFDQDSHRCGTDNVWRGRTVWARVRCGSSWTNASRGDHFEGQRRSRRAKSVCPSSTRWRARAHGSLGGVWADRMAGPSCVLSFAHAGGGGAGRGGLTPALVHLPDSIPDPTWYGQRMHHPAARRWHVGVKCSHTNSGAPAPWSSTPMTS
jgi:hypothetical protein